jgi:hypothetical protein
MFRLWIAYRATASVHSAHCSAVLILKRTKQSLQVAFTFCFRQPVGREEKKDSRSCLWCQEIAFVEIFEGNK